MASLVVLVMHSGRWDSDNCYVDYTIEGVISKESSSYKELYNVIAMQLGVDMNVIKLKIEYKVEESNTPMLIHNNMSVRVYIMLKKAANDFNKYPICISILDNSNNTTELCESSNQEKGMLRSVCINGIAEFETSDKDKATLKSVMERYAIEKRFQYRTVRSNAISLSLLITRENIPSDIRSDVKIYLEVDINYLLAWRAKKKALTSLRGTTSASYSKLLAYLSFMVYLKNKTCSCGKFQYEEIPCEHAWAVLKQKSLVADEYCLDLYKPITVLKIYEIPIYPLPDVAEWVIPEYIMPKKKPRAKTTRELLGLKGKHTCSTCGVVGHNRCSGRNRPQEV
ncbi:hypothetical protein H5410_036806 [Solanum commersonii]|uniref:SWIM-type domain-containing protein n=1 Tax=Solanum commersonii TaxID=4109 RepID=A0A9J5Y9A3_SOLCO|nr:hypothetical protein H5410_036806 [Solanum commersonii]